MLEALLRKIEQAYQHKQWTDLAALDEKLRKQFERRCQIIQREASIEKQKLLLEELQHTMSLYQRLVDGCQQQQITINAQRLGSQRGRRASHAYLYCASA